ncbi:MAG: class I SAM-dependent methyltransferase [Acidimicrobiia bacterium]
MAREQRLVFGEVAEQYDRARPTYPASLVDDVVAYAGLQDGDRLLEVGCGTGKATVLFSARGFRVVALEPDPGMAAVARRNCVTLPVTVETTSFESWTEPGRTFRALLAAQSWHWMRADVRLPKAHALLDPGGAIALFWNQPDWPDSPLHQAIDAVYGRVAPGFGDRTPGKSPLLDARGLGIDELASSPLFGDVTAVDRAWDAAYDARTYVELLDTQSGHRMLPTEVRARLYDGIRDTIEASGGTMTVRYVTDLYLARRAG